jgi:hypothetical protein
LKIQLRTLIDDLNATPESSAYASNPAVDSNPEFMRYLIFEVLGVVLTRALFQYCDGNQNRMGAIEREPYVRKTSP